MKFIFFFLTFGVLSFPFGGWADFYQVPEIAVQATALSAKEAKSQALEQAQKQAFQILMRRLVGKQNPFVEKLPAPNDLVVMVQDLSLKNEKNTPTDYWAQVDVQFKKQAVMDFLSAQKIPFLRQDPPVLMVVPVFKVRDTWVGLEETNPLFRFLNEQNRLSDFYELKLLSGDLDEIVVVNRSLKKGDISELNIFLPRYEAQGILLVKAEQVGENNWRLTGEVYTNGAVQQQQVAFDWYQGYSLETGWAQLLKQMEKETRAQQAALSDNRHTYYARLNEPSLRAWVQDKNRLESLKFIKDFMLQGVFNHQMLVSFSYTGTPEELSEKWRQAGWQWVPDFMGTSGTLVKGVVYE